MNLYEVIVQSAPPGLVHKVTEDVAAAFRKRGYDTKTAGPYMATDRPPEKRDIRAVTRNFQKYDLSVSIELASSC